MPADAAADVSSSSARTPSLRLALRRRLSGWVAAAAAIAACVLLPLGVVAAGLFGPAGETWTHLRETVLADYLVNTAVLAGAAGALSVALGVSSAWFVAACDFPLRRTFEWTLILPLALPTYIAAFAYSEAMDHAAPILLLIREHFGPAEMRAADKWLKKIVLIVIFAAVLYPYVYLAARSAFVRQAGSSALEAARMLGHSPASAFRRVALPLARPSIVAGAALVVMEVLNDYGAVDFFGVPTLTVGIFRTWFALGDPASAIRFAGWLMGFVLLLVILERAQRGRARFDETAGSGRPFRRFRLRGWAAAAACAVCALPLLLGFAIPVSRLAVWAARSFHRVNWDGFGELLLHSLGLAAGSSALLVAAAVVLAFAARVFPSPLMRGLTKVSVLGYAVPGAVIAVGILMPFGALDGLINDWAKSVRGATPGLILSGSLFALVFAYFTRFLAVAFSPIEAGMTRHGGSLDEAARTLGCPPRRALASVILPLIRVPLLAAAALVTVDILKELPLTLILRPFNFETLATKSFDLADEGRIPEAAAPALVIIAAGAAAAIALNRLMRDPNLLSEANEPPRP